MTAVVRAALALATIILLAGCSDRRSVAVEQDETDPRGCPRAHWPGPWTACAEAEWVRQIVADTGYRVTEETGSALVARGNGRSFYIWTTELTPPVRQKFERERHRRLATLDGVDVYGDKRLWRYWVAQGFVFWVQQGPEETSVAPMPEELASLIEASRRRPPPD